jgi:hypothetical protein
MGPSRVADCDCLALFRVSLFQRRLIRMACYFFRGPPNHLSPPIRFASDVASTSPASYVSQTFWL